MLQRFLSCQEKEGLSQSIFPVQNPWRLVGYASCYGINRVSDRVSEGNPKKLYLRPGQQITLLERDGIITTFPDQPLEKFQGILKGMSRIHLRKKRGARLVVAAARSYGSELITSNADFRAVPSAHVV